MMASELENGDDNADRRRALEKFAAAHPDFPKGFPKAFLWGSRESLLIGRFHDPGFVHGLRRALRDANIPSAIKTTRFEAAVYIPESQRSSAFQILSEYQDRNPIPRRGRINKGNGRGFTRRYDLHFVYGMLSFIAMSSFSYYHNSLLVWTASLFACAAAAWEFDRMQISKRWHGRYRFMLLDMFVIIVVAASVLAAINFRRP